MRLHINNAPTVVIKFIDSCILSKTTDNFLKVAVTFAILNFKNTIDTRVIEALKVMADDNGYMDIDTVCENLTQSLDTVGGSVVIPLGMFVDMPFVSKLTVNINKQDITVLKELMKENGV